MTPSVPSHRQVRAGRMARNGERADDLARRRDDLERHHHVLDLAVLRREDARAAMREEAADRRAGDRGRQVHRREARLVAAPLEVLRDDARLRRHRERLLVDLDDPVHALHVEDNAVVDRQRAALAARTTAPRHDRNLVLVRDLHDARDLRRRLRVHDEVRLRARPPTVMPHLRNPVVVDRVAELVGELRVDVLVADDVGQFRTNHLVHVAVFFDLHGTFLRRTKNRTYFTTNAMRTARKVLRADEKT